MRTARVLTWPRRRAWPSAAFGTHLELGLEGFDDVYEGFEIEQHGVEFGDGPFPQPVATTVFPPPQA